MKKLNILLVLFVFINLNTFAQIFTKITEGPLVNDKSDGIGCTWGDYDNDGDLDVYIAVSQPSLNNPNRRNFLYQNNCNGQFTKIIAIPEGIITDEDVSNTATWVDYDNDDDLDLFVTNNAGKKNSLYKNNGDGTFTRIVSGIIVNDISSSSKGCGWADYDNDGNIDLFVANGGDNFLYNNNGDGTFTKITSGDIVTDGSLVSFTPAWADFDNDGDMDLFVANGGIKRLFYRNNGNGTFSLITTIPLITDLTIFIDPNSNVLGCTWADYDNDLDLDLFLTTGIFNRKNFLYRNNNDGTFTQITNGPLVNDLSDTQGSSLWGDYDNDGDLDVFVTNIGRNFLYQNNGDGTFSRVTSEIVETDIIVESWSAVWVDFDNDGDLDLFVPNAFGSPNNFLYLNNGNANHWIDIKCMGTISNSSAVGTRVFAKANINGNDIWQMREININANGFYSGGIPPLNVHLGFGDATIIDSLKIVWPASGITQIFTNVAVDRFIEITEGINAIAIAEPCVPDLPVEDPGFITGIVTNDIDSNCFIDPVIDLGLPNRLIQAKRQSTQENFFVFSDSDGDYEFRVPPAIYEVNQVKIQNDILKELDCPDTDSLYVVTGISGDTKGGNDFINVLVQQVCDVSVSIVGIYSFPLASACPGVSHTYCVTFTNSGSPVKNAILSINLDPNLIILNTSGSCCTNPPPVGQTVSCTIASFPTNASCDICVDVQVPITFSDPLTTTASIDGECGSPPAVFSNSASFTDNNNCALDPNDKLLVAPKGCGFFNNIGRDVDLIYQIRFQNVGTAPAFNIVIRDELDNDLDITTLKLLSTSHLLTRFEIIPENALIFSFENINLPDSASDPEGSNGFVIFSIKPKTNVPDGTTIINQAGIYFDLNEVVLTNSTLNTIRDNPFPIADFEAHHSCTSTGLVFDFTYTGGTSDSAFFEWDFGSDAIPTTSTDENPAGILFANTGLKQVTLTITRFGCVSEITKTVDVTAVQCGKNNDKIIICHTPPGNPGNSKILCINPSSLSDHLGHGDCIGSCAPSTARFAKNQESEVLLKELIFTIYPNPINKEANINFVLFESDIAKLEVYNYMGVRVAILFDQLIKAKLPYNIIFSTENLPAGYYFAVFQTSKERIITKMSILK